MKKFLLTLIVTMLTCIGAWAQEPTIFLDLPTQNLKIGASYELYARDVNDSQFATNCEKSYVGDPTSSDPTSVQVGYGEYGALKVTGIKPTDSPVTVSVLVKNTNVHWSGNVTEYARISFEVNVSGYTCDFSLSPDPSEEGLELEKGETSDYFAFSAKWEGNQDGTNAVESSNSEVVLVNWDGWNPFNLTAKKKGTAIITVSSTYSGQTVKKEFTVNVTDKTLATSLSLGEPNPSSAFYQGTSITVPVTFAPETATFPDPTVSPANQGVTAVLSGNTLTISATESAPTGDYTITVSPQEGSDATPQSVVVTVKDKTHASSIDAPETVSVAYGYTKDIPVTFEPAATAVVKAIYPHIEGVTFSPEDGILSGSNKTITVDATHATASVYNSITLNSGEAGTDQVTKFIDLKIIDPQHVTGVTLKEGETVLGDTKTIDKDDKFTITAEVEPENAADATLTWTNSAPGVASFNPATGEVVGLKAGETTITATSRSIAGQPAQSASVTVIVEETLIANEVGFPTAAITLGTNFTPNVTATDEGIAAENYEVSYTIDPSDVLTLDNGQFTAVKAGTATVTINVNATTAGAAAHYKNAAPIQKIVEVKKNEYTLAISANTKLFKTGDGGNAQISVDEVKFNSNVITSGDYEIKYAVIPEYTGVSVDENTGAVTVGATAAKGQATIVATLTPNDTDNNTVATASVTLSIADVITGGATIKKDGDFYVIDVPYPGALAESLNKAAESGIDDETSAYAALIAAEKVKFTGDINNDDMKKFSQLVGVSGNAPDYVHYDESYIVITPAFPAVLTTLDMSGATLVEAATAGTDNHSFTGDFWKMKMLTVTDFTLPTPAASASVLPTGFGGWCPNATTVTIPEGWTSAKGAFNASATGIKNLSLPSTLKIEAGMVNNANLETLHLAEGIEVIGESAFENCTHLHTVNFPSTLTAIEKSAFDKIGSQATVDMTLDMSACESLTVIGESAFRECSQTKSLLLPPNLIRIENTAFQHHKCEKLYITDDVDYIGCGAFTDWGGSNPLTDIYFLGTTAPSYVDQYAFSPSTQIANKTVNWTLTKPTSTDYFATRQVYTKDSYLSCILHFPKGCEAEYLDMSRDWEAEKRTCNGDGQNKYTPKGWDATTLAAIDAAITARNTELVPIAAGIIGGSITSFAEATLAEEGQSDAGLPDFIYRYDKQWPSFMQMCQAYSIAYGGYHWDGTEMKAAEKDKRGIYQFVLYSADAPSSQTEWEFKGYENDKWYTICIPFDMTVDQIKSVFGSKTQVCRFSGVKRETETENKVLTLYFRNSVMDEGDGRADGTNYNDADFTGISGKHTGIMHHYPYMIKPSGNDATCDTKDEDGQLVRIFEGYDRVGGILALETRTAGGYTYTFSGVFEQNSLTQFSYFLGRKTKDAEHLFYFYKDATDPNKSWNEYTATVVVSDGGVNDAETFFGISSGTQQSAPRFTSVFGDDEEVTAIEDVEDVVKTKVLNDGKVYSISGQVMNSENLPVGVYVKNGRKFIVK